MGMRAGLAYIPGPDDYRLETGEAEQLHDALAKDAAPAGMLSGSA